MILSRSNRKQAFYWKGFLLATAEICKRHQHLVSENVGTANEYQRYSCDGCPYQVSDFGATKLTGYILSTPDEWGRPDQLRYILRETLRNKKKGGAARVKKKAVKKYRKKAGRIDAEHKG